MDQAHPNLGPVALVGGGEWLGDDEIDRRLLELGGPEVLVLPTAAAYERPQAAVETAAERYESLGGKVRASMVLTRRDAEREAFAAEVRSASFIYLAGGSPLHLRVTLKDSLVFDALVQAWRRGALVAGSSAGAMVLSDPMIDPRGGAFTVGLGVVRDLAVIPHYQGERTPQLERTLALAPASCAVVALGERTGIIRASDGTWVVIGHGPCDVFAGGERAGLDALAGKRVG